MNGGPTNVYSDTSERSESVQSVAVLACGEHAELVADILDCTGILSWTQLPASQSRRSGYLQNVPRRHAANCCFFLGFGSAAAVQSTVKELCRARARGQLCPECSVFSWSAAQLAKPDLCLDPVCDSVVDSGTAASAEYGGRNYYFCSDSCRDVFKACPSIHLERLSCPCRVDRRDLAPIGVNAAS